MAAASAKGTAEARAALEELYRLYCYPVYAFIRRRGHGRQDAQDLTQDFFVHLLVKGTVSRADPHRGRFRNFLLGALEHFLANAGERACAVQLTASNLKRMSVLRHSSKTMQIHGIGGWVGGAEYAGTLGQFLPFLRCGEWCGVGRHCVWGNGHILVTVCK